MKTSFVEKELYRFVSGSMLPVQGHARPSSVPEAIDGTSDGFHKRIRHKNVFIPNNPVCLTRSRADE
jgi:hypothetical protein